MCVFLVRNKTYSMFFYRKVRSQDFTYHAQMQISFFIKMKHFFANSKMNILISFYLLERHLYRSCTQSTTFRYIETLPRGYKTFFMLNSTEHKIFLLIIVGILTFMSKKNSILSYLFLKKLNFLIFFLHLWAFKISL